jgi:hypothetical protein
MIDKSTESGRGLNRSLYSPQPIQGSRRVWITGERGHRDQGLGPGRNPAGAGAGAAQKATWIRWESAAAYWRSSTGWPGGRAWKVDELREDQDVGKAYAVTVLQG